MPEIDTDTFQVIALVLSGLALLVSLVVLSAVSKLRKELAERPSGRQESAPARQAAPQSQSYEPQAAAPAAAAQSAYEPQAARPAAQPAASKEAEPALAGAAAPAAAEELPVEQPFERDGRWWYKRGDELLVYDEGSGQWEPAPAGSLTGGGVSPPAVDTAYTPVGEASRPETGTTAPETGGDEGTGFWKCPSCGAVNGATATSCRMCFTAKP